VTGAHYPRIRGTSLIRTTADLWRNIQTRFDRFELRSIQQK
jgi:hypothetical protein